MTERSLAAALHRLAEEWEGKSAEVDDLESARAYWACASDLRRHLGQPQPQQGEGANGGTA